MCALRVVCGGRPYRGFQRQPDVPTIEDAIFGAYRAFSACNDDKEPTDYAAAGWTSAGVFTFAQTIVFECPDWCTPWALNSEPPGTVRAWTDADAPDDFRARHWPARREYVYDPHVPTEGFDDDRAKAIFDVCRSDCDFHSLTSDDHGTVRAIDGNLTRDGDFLLVRAKAGGFVRGPVRRFVLLVCAVRPDAAPLSKVDDALGPDHLDGPEGIAPVLPMSPLPTTADYPEVEFDVDVMIAENVVAAFEEWVLADRIGWHVGSRICGGVEQTGDARRVDGGKDCGQPAREGSIVLQSGWGRTQ